MKAPTTEYLEIDGVRYLSGYKVRLLFSDGTERIMDFGPFLRKAQNPDLTKYRDLKQFKDFRLHHGNLMWGDYEMVFPIADLHRGEI
jgi:hypothetical protein